MCSPKLTHLVAH
uniref:Uncharacterized protein n=1 Tax=Anguilla anguilla TaxID=7936 RepID=A0A0E9R9L0_ANGAN